MNLVGLGMEPCLENGDPNCFAPASKANGYWEARELLTAVGEENQYAVLNMDAFICPNRTCQNVVHGIQQFQDAVHIQQEYARLVAPDFEALLDPYW